MNFNLTAKALESLHQSNVTHNLSIMFVVHIHVMLCNVLCMYSLYVMF